MSKKEFYSCDCAGCDVLRPAQGEMAVMPDGWYQLLVRGEQGKYLYLHFHSLDCLHNHVLDMREWAQEERQA